MPLVTTEVQLLIGMMGNFICIIRKYQVIKLVMAVFIMVMKMWMLTIRDKLSKFTIV